LFPTSLRSIFLKVLLLMVVVMSTLYTLMLTPTMRRRMLNLVRQTVVLNQDGVRLLVS
jgi:hypothetical protein